MSDDSFADDGVDAGAGELDEAKAPQSGSPSTLLSGYIKYYGLFWKKSYVDWSESKLMMGSPRGGIGAGRRAADQRPTDQCMNFWFQKGVYVLYDVSFTPIYAGQAGSPRRGIGTNAVIGERLSYHEAVYYKHAWEYFSWFGFLPLENPQNVRDMPQSERERPTWGSAATVQSADEQLRSALNSTEAVLIEAFSPRFNRRGGNMTGATMVDQLEPSPA